jgi:hypothetical protein
MASSGTGQLSRASPDWVKDKNAEKTAAVTMVLIFMYEFQ